MALKLLDAITRHQIYLEGLKYGQIATYQTTAKAIERDVKAKLIGLRYDTMDGLTKAQLRKLLAELRTTLNRHYSQYVENLIAFLRKFMATDTEIVKAMFGEFIEGDMPDAPSDDKRWGAIGAFPLPSSGALLLPWIRALQVQGTGSILLRINQGYANREKVSDTLAALVGSDAANFRDGVLNKTGNAASSVVRTALQHVAASNQASIAKILWPSYKWVSVLDDRTTKICRNRNGNVYRYGEGPLPPAHPGCRSSTMPIAAGQDIDTVPIFAEWVRTQPADLRRDMFGTADNSAEFAGSPPLTLAAFAAKKGRILQDA